MIHLYSLYLGCVVPNLFPEVELSVRSLLHGIGVEVEDLRGTSCCLPPPIFGFNSGAWLRVNERNMKLAKHDVITVCDECFASMQDAREILVGSGSSLSNVLPLIKLLGGSVEKIKEAASFDVKVRCAIQHSCHLLRPSKVRGVDDARHPRLVRSVLEAIGCEVVAYEDELSCCGGSVHGESEASKELALRKLRSIEASGVDLVVTTCPHCMKQLLGHDSKLPVLHIAQLCALALGTPPDKIGIEGLLRLNGVLRRK